MSATTADSPAPAHWFMAVLLLGAALGIVIFLPMEWVLDVNAPDFNPLIFIPLFVGAFGVYHLVHAILWTRRGQRSGSATMTLDGPGPVRMGGRIKGTVRTARPLQPAGDYVLSLQCVERYDFRSQGHSATDVRHDHAHVVWESTLRVPPGEADSTRGIPFAFDLPTRVREAPAPRDPNAPSATVKAVISIPFMKKRIVGNATPSATAWRLVVSAPMAGPDFKASFDVFVEPG